ncbi:CinA family protein [Porphyromonas pogonae]|uniref:CinA family protein n=1 Tax=Porphyromonas pogonae TaxID=867595 RepID=UPI002E76BF2E|nr:CinA family protein [Porphyromonas pogonae]
MADQLLLQKLIQLLSARHLTIAVAESCTGGLVSSMLTDVAGVSKVYKGSIVAYHNDIKERVLGVDRHDLDKYTAVSQPVAMQMAQNVRLLMSADIGLSTTGYAGPSTDNPADPPGTVWIGIAWGDDNAFTQRLFVPGTRRHVRQQTASILLTKTIEIIQQSNK